MSNYCYKDTNSERIGKSISSIRQKRGLSVIQLADAVGIDVDRIRKYERGQRKPKPEMLETIADVLDVSPLALQDPIINEEIGLMYALFEIRKIYGLKINKDDYSLIISNKNTIYFKKYLKEWCELMENGDEEALLEWELHFPDSVKTDDKEQRKKEIKEQIEKLQNELKKLDEN